MSLLLPIILIVIIVFPQSNFIATWEPQNWKEALQNLEKMREKKGAPVDTMGCHMAADLNAEPIVCCLNL